MINITEGELKEIKGLLKKYATGCEVRAFGSRITRNVKNYSDLDLVIVGNHKVVRKDMICLKEAFEESKLPFRVDVLDWHNISDDFKKVIENDYVVVQ